MEAGSPHNGGGALDGTLEESVLSGSGEARGQVYDEAETIRLLEADRRRVCCPSGIQEALAERVSDSIRRCQVNGEGMEDVTGYVPDTEVTAKSPSTTTQSASEGRDSGELKEVTEGKEEATHNFPESATTAGKDEAISAASNAPMGNIPDHRSELDSRNELLKPISGHRENGTNQSGLSMSGNPNPFPGEHMETMENVEVAEDKILPLNGDTFCIDSSKEIEEKGCPCDDNGVPFENVSTSHETGGTPNIESNYSTFHAGRANAKCSNNYSIDKLLALRFINVEEQQKRWTCIYTNLGPVARELDEISASEQPRKSRKNVDRRQRRKKLKDSVPEVSCSEASHADSRLSGELVAENVEDDHEYIGTNKSVYVLSGDTDAENVEKDHKDMGTPDHVLDVNIDVDPAVEIACEEYEDSDDEYDSIQRPAFYVEGEPDFESGPPQDGLEYLRRVRWEAMQIPNFKVAKIDKSKLKIEQTPYMPSIPEIADCPNNFTPSQHWVEAFLTDFSQLKQALSQMESSDINTSSSRKILDKQGTTPLLSVILSLDAVSRAAMFRRHVKALENNEALSRPDLEWAFALSVALDEPVDAETSASIRCLLRKCALLRASKIDYDDDVVMMNIIITIAGKYFGQSEK